MAWATLGFSGVAAAQEPPLPVLPQPRPMPEAPKDAPKTPEVTPLPMKEKKDQPDQPRPLPMPDVPRDAAKTPEVAPLPTKEKKDQPVLPQPRPLAETAKDAAKTDEGAPTRVPETNDQIAPAYPGFVDPRAYVWTQHRLAPADQPCVEMACQLRVCIRDHRCLRERMVDWVLHWPCPGRLIFGKCCPDSP